MTSMPQPPLGSLVDGQARMRGSFGVIAEVWAEVKQGWRDQQAERFEREQLAPLGPSLARLARGLDELLELAQRSQRELSDDEAAD